MQREASKMKLTKAKIESQVRQAQSFDDLAGIFASFAQAYGFSLIAEQVRLKTREFNNVKVAGNNSPPESQR